MERRQFRAPRGIRDVLPEEIPAWRFLEDTARRLSELRGYREIRPALLEEVDLFTRSVGEVTDIVQKEMFTLQKGDGMLALRPEGTAGIVRAYVEAGFPSSAPLQRLYHVGPMFRYERPQKGRERMFTQFDVEVLGSLDPRLDAEVIHLAASFFGALGFELERLEVRVNSMGDGDDRDRWREAVRAFLAPTIAEHCELCQERFGRNVLRVLDCKNPRCQELNRGAPGILAFLSAENRLHFGTVQELLRALGLKVVVDPSIVRGLDYYTRTAFETRAGPRRAQRPVRRRALRPPDPRARWARARRGRVRGRLHQHAPPAAGAREGGRAARADAARVRSDRRRRARGRGLPPRRGAASGRRVVRLRRREALAEGAEKLAAKGDTATPSCSAATSSRAGPCSSRTSSSASNTSSRAASSSRASAARSAARDGRGPSAPRRRRAPRAAPGDPGRGLRSAAPRPPARRAQRARPSRRARGVRAGRAPAPDAGRTPAAPAERPAMLAPGAECPGVGVEPRARALLHDPHAHEPRVLVPGATAPS
jgi:hypothetical protein